MPPNFFGVVVTASPRTTVSLVSNLLRLEGVAKRAIAFMRQLAKEVRAAQPEP